MLRFPTPYPRFLIAAALVALPACRENILGPLNNTAFVLRTVDGQDLPVSVSYGPGDLAWVVTADTIWFESGSKWRRHTVQHREEGVGGDPLDRETEGSVVRQDGLLILDFECDDGGDCIAPDRLVENATSLEMEHTYRHAGQNLIFERI